MGPEMRPLHVDAVTTHRAAATSCVSPGSRASLSWPLSRSCAVGSSKPGSHTEASCRQRARAAPSFLLGGRGVGNRKVFGQRLRISSFPSCEELKHAPSQHKRTLCGAYGLPSPLCVSGKHKNERSFDLLMPGWFVRAASSFPSFSKALLFALHHLSVQTAPAL